MENETLVAVEQDFIRILKVGVCQTLSGRSSLTYQVGCDAEGKVQFRIFKNSGGGYYSNEWVSARDLERLLRNFEIVTSANLSEIFKGRSANNGGFLLSALKAEGLFERSIDNPRSYVAVESPAFVVEIQGLIAAGANLDANEKPGKKSSKTRKAAASRAN